MNLLSSLPTLLPVTLALITPAVFASGADAAQPASARQCLVYFGTYTGAKSKGIYVARMDATSGKLTEPELAAESKSPSFLAVHPNRRFLYAVNESGANIPGGAVTAYALQPETGKLTQLNQQSSQGRGPCHLTLDKAGRNVLVANYGGGSVAVLPVKADGQLGEATSFIQHQGSSVNRRRQEGPHAHGIYLDPDNRFAFVPDLGLDQVLIYKFDPTKGTLAPSDPAFAALKPGSGPRHLAFHPNGRFAYVINELANTVTVFACNFKQGTLTELQTLGTLPGDFTGNSSTAEIEVHPNGKFLYGSNRGHDSLAVFSVDDQKGTLTFLTNVSTQGKAPRHFAIDPTGEFLLAANQGSDSVVVFKLNPQTGQLAPAGQTLSVGAPVCTLFVPAR